MLELRRELSGSILDIGGGGEGVIGQLYGGQVLVIDNRQEELDEAPDCCEKLLMDATAMSFKDASFDHATFFYSLMFMREEEQLCALREAARVVKQNGWICIWDCEIVSAFPEPFVADVEIALPDRRIRTAYGVGKVDRQSLRSVHTMCEAAGLTVETAETDGVHFFIKCRKA